MSEALAHRFTANEYHILSDRGLFNPGARVELLDGLILDMCPTGPKHNEVVSWLSQKLTEASRGRFLTISDRSLHLSALYEPQPDVMLLRPAEHGYRSILPEAQDVFLLIEVAEKSPAFDRSMKLPAYAAGKIPEVWIVNIPCLLVEVYREPDGISYLQRQTVGPGRELWSAGFPDLALNTSGMFASGAAG